ncbi:HIT domain-containing protein [Candidatus Saccharibacteria bacterium]|nr:HIT domain-containing protein [Candidatus Saccharibacteria bacterium]
MVDSIFTKIIKGDIPSFKVYEDDLTYAFLDIHPIQPGHVLVIPKKQVEFVWDLDGESYLALMTTVKKTAQHMKNVLEVPFIGEMVVGVDVPHAHVHLVPFTKVEQFRNVPDMSAIPDNQALLAMAEKLRFHD